MKFLTVALAMAIASPLLMQQDPVSAPPDAASTEFAKANRSVPHEAYEVLLEGKATGSTPDGEPAVFHLETWKTSADYPTRPPKGLEWLASAGLVKHYVLWRAHQDLRRAGILTVLDLSDRDRPRLVLGAFDGEPSSGVTSGTTDAGLDHELSAELFDGA